MNKMFKDCSSLISLPDISKWNLKKGIKMNQIFEGCKSLVNVPDLSLWKLANKESEPNISNLYSSSILNELESIKNISENNSLNNNFKSDGLAKISSNGDFSSSYELRINKNQYKKDSVNINENSLEKKNEKTVPDDRYFLSKNTEELNEFYDNFYN